MMIAIDNVHMPPQAHHQQQQPQDPATCNNEDEEMECSESSVPMVIVVRITPKKQPSAISLAAELQLGSFDDDEESYFGVFTQEDSSDSSDEDYTVATFDEQQSMFTSPFARNASAANVSPSSGSDDIPSRPQRLSSVDPTLVCPPAFMESVSERTVPTMNLSVPKRLSSLDPSLSPSTVFQASIPPAFTESVSDTTVPMMNLSVPKRLSSLDPSVVLAASTPPAFVESCSDMTVPRMPRRIDSCDPATTGSVISIDDDDHTLISIKEDCEYQNQRSFKISSIRKELESKPLTAIPPSFVAASKANGDGEADKPSKIDWRNNSLVRYKNRSRSPRGIKNSLFSSGESDQLSLSPSGGSWKNKSREEAIKNARSRRLANSQSLRKLYSKTNQDPLQHLPPAFHHLLEKDQKNIVNAAALVASASKSRRNLSPKGSFRKKSSRKNLNGGSTPPRLTLKRIRSISSLSTSSSIMSMVEHEDDTSIVQMYRFSSKSLLDDDDLLSALVEV